MSGYVFDQVPADPYLEEATVFQIIRQEHSPVAERIKSNVIVGNGPGRDVAASARTLPKSQVGRPDPDLGDGRSGSGLCYRGPHYLLGKGETQAPGEPG